MADDNSTLDPKDPALAGRGGPGLDGDDDDDHGGGDDNNGSWESGGGT
jgi:hypothetical protein